MEKLFALQPMVGPLYTHGIFFAVAALIATLVLIRLSRLAGISPVAATERAVWIFFAGLAGARLGFFLVYPSAWQSGGQLVAFWEGGLLSFTGIAAGFLVAWLFGQKLPVEQRGRWLDALVIAGLIGWAIGRWGNYYAGESYGLLSPVWEIWYGRVPIQLFESLACLLLGGILWIKVAAWPAGKVALWGVTGYFAARLVIDTWRDEASVYGLHLSQWTAVLILLVVLIVNRKRYAT